jgi:polysaccharide export outer membrane protein
MQKKHIGFKILTGIFFLIIALSSCVPMKKQVYLQTSEDTAKTEYLNKQLIDYKLRPANNLYIKVISLEQDVSDFFNMGLSQSGNVYYDAAIYLNSYSVDDSGFVEMPFLGEIYVKDLTLEEVKNKIQDQVNKYLNKTMVIVKLVNYNVSIVGEITKPGQYKIYQDKINIFEVLSLAGDLTTFAKRDDIILVRKNEKGSKMYHINLLKDDVLESDYYYIMPDDIIYIRPVKGKNFAFNAFPYTLVISSISLMLALIAIFK